MTTLLVQSSARSDASITRRLARSVAEKLGAPVVTRDVADGLPFVDENWVGANFTAPEDRSDAQREALGVSDTLVEELEAAEVIVIGAPVYNFSIPAALKAWVDLVTRARRTFRYTANGKEGLLKGKRAILVVASGGVGVGSEIDFATPYLRFILGFIGITDVEIVAADRTSVDQGAVARAEAEIARLAA